MRETDLRVLLSHPQDVGIEVAERGREQQRGAILLDHGGHRLLHVGRLRHLLLLDHDDAGHLLDRGGRLGLRLAVTVVVAWADIDDAYHEFVGGGRAARAETADRSQRAYHAEALQHLATIEPVDGISHFALLAKLEDREAKTKLVKQGASQDVLSRCGSQALELRAILAAEIAGRRSAVPTS